MKNYITKIGDLVKEIKEKSISYFLKFRYSKFVVHYSIFFLITNIEEGIMNPEDFIY
jgi:hypothetical protein